MHEHNTYKIITTLSDYEILKLAFTDLECAQEIVKATGSESFIPDLLTAVKANKDNYDNIGLAIRKVLGEQLNPMIQLDEFQDDFKYFKETKLPERCENTLGKLVGGPLGRRLGKILPNINSTDDLINFTIRNSSSSSNLIQLFGSSAAKTLQNIRIVRSLFGTDLSTIKKELSELSEKSGYEGDRFVKASKQLSSIIATLKKNVASEDEDEFADIFQKKANVTIDDITKIIHLIDDDTYQKLKKNIEDRCSSKSKKNDYDSEIQKKDAAIRPIEDLLKKENKETRKIIAGNTNESTYAESVISIVNLGIKTCKNQPKEIPPNNQISKLLQNGKISPKVKARLSESIIIINNRAQDLKKQAEHKEEVKLASVEAIEAPISTAEVTKIEQHYQEESLQSEDEAIEQNNSPMDDLPEDKEQEEELPEITTKPELETQGEKTIKEEEPENTELEQLQEDLKVAEGLIERLDPKEGEKPHLNPGEKEILKLMYRRKGRLDEQIKTITGVKATAYEHTTNSSVQELGKQYLAEDKPQAASNTQNEHQNLQDDNAPEQENNIKEKAADTNSQEATKKQGVLESILSAISAIKEFVSSFFKANIPEPEPPVTTPPNFPPADADSFEGENPTSPEPKDDMNPLNQNKSDNKGITDTEESDDSEGEKNGGMQL